VSTTCGSPLSDKRKVPVED